MENSLPAVSATFAITSMCASNFISKHFFMVSDAFGLIAMPNSADSWRREETTMSVSSKNILHQSVNFPPSDKRITILSTA